MHDTNNTLNSVRDFSFLYKQVRIVACIYFSFAW